MNGAEETSLQRRMRLLGIKEKDIEERFIIGSGPGGQKIQKTASCVYLKHVPSGIEVKCQQERSRGANRTVAREILCTRMENTRRQKHQETRALQSKKRQQNRRRTKLEKLKMIDEKRRRSKRKSLRSKPKDQD
jgi:protein subunit release factor B